MQINHLIFKLLTLLVCVFMYANTFGQYTKPTHRLGTCAKDSNNREIGKSKIVSILIYNSNLQKVFYQTFDSTPNCSTAKSNNFYTALFSKTAFFLSEDEEYTVNIGVTNPDGSLALSRCGVWIDFEYNSNLTGKGEFISPNSFLLSTVYDNEFKFTVPKLAKTALTYLRIRTEGYDNTMDASKHSSELEYGESFDIVFKQFTPNNPICDFWCDDTVSDSTDVFINNANPQKAVTSKWYVDGVLQNDSTSNNLVIQLYGAKDSLVVKLVNSYNSWSDSTIKTIYVAKPSKTSKPVFIVTPSETQLYNIFTLSDMSTNYNNYNGIGWYNATDTFKMYYHPHSNIHRITDIFTAKGIPGYPGEGSWTFCFEVGHGKANYGKGEVICKKDFVLVGADVAKPYVILNGSDSVFFELGKKYTSLGAYGFDKHDGVLRKATLAKSNINFKKEGTYYEKYIIADSAGNISNTVIRYIIITRDVTPPILTLKGSPCYTFNYTGKYVEFGWTATDLADGDLDSSVQVYGAINYSKLGVYYLTYIVFDEAGNSDTAARCVYIIDDVPPQIHGRISDTITIGIHTTYNYIDHIRIFDFNTDSIYLYEHLQVLVNNVDTSRMGTYQTRLLTVDSMGNYSDTFTLTVLVKDIIPPTLSSTISDTIWIKKHTVFNYKEYIHIEDDQSDSQFLFQNVKTIFNNVNTNVIGTYHMTLVAFDSSSNASDTLKLVIIVQHNSSVKSILKGTSMGVYPNPTSGQINVISDLQIQEIWLLDMVGKKILLTNITLVDIGHYLVGLPELPSSTYNLMIIFKNGQHENQRITLIREK